jgi:hypothetical protein
VRKERGVEGGGERNREGEWQLERNGRRTGKREREQEENNRT